MAFEAARFVHAGNLFVDHQLRGTGALQDSMRTIVEDATVLAFQRVIEACLERRADFLVLAGNSFDDSDFSVRARTTLAVGFERLAEAGIQVFVFPGSADPANAWRDAEFLLENATLISPEVSEPIACLKEDRVIATIATAQTLRLANHVTRSERVREPTHPSAWHRPFTIAVDPSQGSRRACEIDSASPSSQYMSVPEQTVPEQTTGSGSRAAADEPFDYVISLTAGSAAAAGAGTAAAGGSGPEPCDSATQGLSPDQAGPRGCRLVVVDPSGTIQTHFIPTAAVRWETVAIDAAVADNPEELIRHMQHTLQPRQPEANERIWLINWELRGLGAGIDSLHESARREALLDSLDQQIKLPDGVLTKHLLQLAPHQHPIESIAQSNSFAEEYLEGLPDHESETSEMLRYCLNLIDGDTSVLSDRFGAVLNELDHRAIVDHARRRGLEWFATSR